MMSGRWLTVLGRLSMDYLTTADGDKIRCRGQTEKRWNAATALDNYR